MAERSTGWDASASEVDMATALDLAREAGRSGEVPVGAVVVVDGGTGRVEVAEVPS